MKESKKTTTMAIVWIVIYVVLMSVGQGLNGKLEMEGAATAPISIALVAALCIFLKGGWKEYGFRSFKGFPFAAALFFLPFIVLLTVRFWKGAAMNVSEFEVVLHTVYMFGVGFIEEVVFRGLLFRSMMKQGVRSAVIVSSVTFGIGHIVNLINGAELLPTLLQLVYAVAIGFMLSVFVLRTKNIIPCIIFHGVFNALSVFSNEAAIDATFRIVSCIIITVISIGYALYMWFHIPEIKEDQKQEA